MGLSFFGEGAAIADSYESMQVQSAASFRKCRSRESTAYHDRKPSSPTKTAYSPIHQCGFSPLSLGSPGLNRIPTPLRTNKRPMAVMHLTGNEVKPAVPKDTLRVQVSTNHIPTSNLCYKYYYRQPKYQIIWQLGPSRILHGPLPYSKP